MDISSFITFPAELILSKHNLSFQTSHYIPLLNEHLNAVNAFLENGNSQIRF